MVRGRAFTEEQKKDFTPISQIILAKIAIIEKCLENGKSAEGHFKAIKNPFTKNDITETIRALEWKCPTDGCGGLCWVSSEWCIKFSSDLEKLDIKMRCNMCDKIFVYKNNKYTTLEEIKKAWKEAGLEKL